METEPTETTETPSTDSTDWDIVSEKIGEQVSNQLIEKMIETQSTYETIEAVHGSQIGDFRIIHEATLGDLLIAFFLAALTSTILLKWLFKAIWGR